MIKKIFLLICISILSQFSFANSELLSIYDKKILNFEDLKIKDLYFEVRNEDLKQRLNDQLSYGVIKELVFKVYWTELPLRLKVDTEGIGEGFKELKEELALMLTQHLEHLFVQSYGKKFSDFIITKNSNASLKAKSKSGLSTVVEYDLYFNKSGVPQSIVGILPAGEWKSDFKYIARPESRGKYLLGEQKLLEKMVGFTTETTKKLEYQKIENRPLLSRLSIEIITTSLKGAQQRLGESFVFSNYQVDKGLASRKFSE